MSYLQNFVGNTLFVDANPNFGNDDTGERENAARPFLTITAALAAAASGDLVEVRSGTYNESFTIPAGVVVRGAATKAVTIQKLLVTADTTLVTMGENSRLEDVALKLTSAEHHTLVGVKFGGTTSATARLRTYTLAVDNSTAGAGASDVVGILVQSTGTPDSSVLASRAGTVTVSSAGTGTKRGLLLDTSVGNFYSGDTRFLITTGTGIAAEINKAGAILGFDSGTFNAPDADVSQTAGTLSLGDCDLVHSTTNGLAFSTTRYSLDFVWADPGGMPGNVTRFGRPGTSTFALAETKLKLPRKAVVKTLHIRAVGAPGVGKSDVFTIRKNGVDTILTATLADANVSVSDLVHAISFMPGDDLSVKIVTAIGTGTNDVVIAVEVY